MERYVLLSPSGSTSSGDVCGADSIFYVQVVAIIDIDCAVADGFDETDKYYLEELAKLMGEACDW